MNDVMYWLVTLLGVLAALGFVFFAWVLLTRVIAWHNRRVDVVRRTYRPVVRR